MMISEVAFSLLIKLSLGMVSIMPVIILWLLYKDKKKGQIW